MRAILKTSNTFRGVWIYDLHNLNIVPQPFVSQILYHSHLYTENPDAFSSRTQSNRRLYESMNMGYVCDFVQ